MIKIFHFILPAVMIATALSSQAQIARCTPDIGTELVGDNGIHFCLSKITLNWWSAHSWCHAIGMKLATPTEACDSELQNCLNLRNQGAELGYPSIWLSTPYSNVRAYSLHNPLQWRLYAELRTYLLRVLCAPGS